MRYNQYLPGHFSFVHFIPLPNRPFVQFIKPHAKPLRHRQKLTIRCGNRQHDENRAIPKNKAPSSNTVGDTNYQRSSSELPYLVGLDLFKRDLERLRALITRLVDHNGVTLSTESQFQTASNKRAKTSTDRFEEDVITNLRDIDPSDASSSALPPKRNISTEKAEKESSKPFRRKSNVTYEPRSTTGQIVAEQFSGMRGAFERAITSARFRAADAIRAALLTASTVTMAMRGAAVRLLGRSTFKSQPFQQQKLGEKQLRQNWPLSSSFHWQTFNVIRKPSHTDATSRLTSQRRIRMSSLRRTVQSRNNARRATVFISGMTRLADVIIPSAWRTATAALPPGKRGGALAVMSVGAAIILSSGAPVAGMVSGVSVALTSYAVISARASVTNKRAFHTLVDLPINWPNSASIRAVHTPISQRISRAQERYFWKQRKVINRKSSGIKFNNQSVLRSSKAIALNRRVSQGKQPVFAKVDTKTTARARLDIDDKKGMNDAHDYTEEVDDINEKAGQSIETAAYVIREAQPWLLSLPLVGVALSLLDFFVYNLEQISGRVLGRLGLKVQRNPTRNDGWLLLSSLDQRDG